MASKEFKTDIDLQGNSIKNGGFEVVTSLPTTNNFVGRIVTYQGRSYIWGGSAWKCDSDTLGGNSSTVFTKNNSTSSSDLLGLVTFTKSLQLTTDWQDTGIAYADLETGTYIITCYVGYNYSVGGDGFLETYAGLIQWYKASTNSPASDEIPLHRSGHAPNNGILYLRTLRSRTSQGGQLKLQIAYSLNTTGVFDYIFKFRRLI